MQRETSSETYGISLIIGKTALLHHPLVLYLSHEKIKISLGAPTLKKTKTTSLNTEATFFASTARSVCLLLQKTQQRFKFLIQFSLVKKTNYSMEVFRGYRALVIKAAKYHTVYSCI